MKADEKRAVEVYMKSVRDLVSQTPSGKLYCELRLLGRETEEQGQETDEALKRWKALDTAGKALSVLLRE